MHPISVHVLVLQPPAASTPATHAMAIVVNLRMWRSYAAREPKPISVVPSSTMRRRSLSQLSIPIPCHADWSAMAHLDQDGRARFCDSCARPVYDGRSLTRGELHALISQHEGALPCVRLHRRPDGTIVTRSCVAPVLRAGRALWLKAGLASIAFWTAVVALCACTWRPLRSLRSLVAPSRPTSLLTLPDDARAESRKTPFVIKPPAEPATPAK